MLFASTNTMASGTRLKAHQLMIDSGAINVSTNLDGSSSHDSNQAYTSTTTGQVTQLTGSTTPTSFSILDPYLVVQFIIKY